MLTDAAEISGRVLTFERLRSWEARLRFVVLDLGVVF